MQRVFFLLALWLAAVAGPAALAQDAGGGGSPADLPSFRALAALEQKGAVVSAQIVDLDAGRTIAELGADRAVTPASVTKLVLAAALLDRLGPEHTFATRVLADGQLRDGGRTLVGDLVIDASGEPGLTNEYLWRLATDVSRFGLRRVTGRLVLNTSLFASIAADERDTNRQAGLGGSSHAYDSPLSAGAVNYSVVGVFVAPGDKRGDKARVALEPYPLGGFDLVNEVRTVAAGRQGALSVTRTTKGSRDILRATGTIAADEPPRTMYRSVSDPDRYALAVLESFFAAAGVKVGSRVVSREGPSRGRPILTLESQPLEWQLRGLLRQSNNFVADMLTIQLDPAPRGKTLAGGNAQIASFLARVTGVGATGTGGARPAADGTTIASGSGLTPGNRLSAAAVVRVLSDVYRRDAQFGHLYAALPGAGVEGTLKKRFDSVDGEWLVGRLRAKTGTLTEPHLAIGMAGYCRTKAGQWTAFSIMINGTASSRGLSVATARKSIEDDLELILGGS